MKDKALKFIKAKQKAYFKEHSSYATDDITISKWVEEYHENCVMESALNDAVLGNANEELVLRKLWMDIVAKRMAMADISTQSFDVGGFADSIVMSYRGTFIDYIPPIPPEPYYPPEPAQEPERNYPVTEEERNWVNNTYEDEEDDIL